MLNKEAEWLVVHYPAAAASLKEGMEETFTINRLNLSPTLRHCLGTTNIIESPYAGVRIKRVRVSRWRDGKMVLRWAASASLATEKRFRKIMGYKDLWTLQAALGREGFVAACRHAANLCEGADAAGLDNIHKVA